MKNTIYKKKPAQKLKSVVRKSNFQDISHAVFTFQIRKSKKFLNIFDLEITSNPAAAYKKSRLLE